MPLQPTALKPHRGKTVREGRTETKGRGESQTRRDTERGRDIKAHRARDLEEMLAERQAGRDR